jgi:hypothetical protein
MIEEVFRSGRFAGFSVHDPFAQAANRESPVVFNLGAISWPDNLGPASLKLGSYPLGQKITGAVNFKADVLIVLYTDLETRAFLDVFTGNNEWSAARQASWYPYSHNFSSLASSIQDIAGSIALKNGIFGYLSGIQVGDQKVVVYKTELHPKVNGTHLAFVKVIQQLAAELQPSLMITTGSAGGIGSGINCGDVVVASQARFHVRSIYPTYPLINTLSTSSQPLTNTVAINPKYLKYAAENFTKLTLPSLATCYGQFRDRAGYAFLKKNTGPPSIYVTDINPVPESEPMAVVTADYLTVDDTTDAEGLQALGTMNDNDDGYACFAIDQIVTGPKPKWLSVRNASDPQVQGPASFRGTPAALDKELSTLGGAIFGVYEYVTTINSAFACWGAVAGNAKGPASSSANRASRTRQMSRTRAR